MGAAGAHPRVASLAPAGQFTSSPSPTVLKETFQGLVGKTLGPPAGNVPHLKRSPSSVWPNGQPPSPLEGGRLCGRLIAAPTAENGPEALTQPTQAQFWNRTSGKFPPTQGPSGPGWSRRQALLVLRAGNFAELLRSGPRKWGPGGREYGRGAPILSVSLVVLW